MIVLSFSSIAKQIMVRKIEDRKAHRCSTRFSLFLQAAEAAATDHVECEMEKER